jgi:hypothetical protein
MRNYLQKVEKRILFGKRHLGGHCVFSLLTNNGVISGGSRMLCRVMFGNPVLEVGYSSVENALKFNECRIVWVHARGLFHSLQDLAERGNQFWRSSRAHDGLDIDLSVRVSRTFRTDDQNQGSL